ncbi:MAG: hypothetical protein IT368_15340, partial [Candidatus Hydrogenedentes bacterium]|nr:hypothetical protein [Candidatus Hydrogenedentota bacterium]
MNSRILLAPQRAIGGVRLLASIAAVLLTSAGALAAISDPVVSNTSTDEDTPVSITIGTAGGDADTTHFKITAITNGTMTKSDTVTAITSGTFITKAEGAAGVRFVPTAN